MSANPTLDPTSAADPASPPVNPISDNAQQLGWCVQRLAALQGRGVDRLQLHDSQLSHDSAAAWRAQAEQLCLQLAWPAPTWIAAMDQARLPVLHHDATLGWVLIVARSAEGQWQTEGPTGKKELEFIHGRAVSGLQLNIPTLAAGPKKAFRVIWQSFTQYKTTVFEGALASLLINVLALATSFFSMQVYDRVIPSQGFNTLWLLSMGVALSIVFEFVLKWVRSRVMEHAVVGLDASISRDIFQRLLSVRLDQLPQSVGSLAAQMRAYEGIRALLTASTAYLLVDVPFALVFVIVIGALGTPLLLFVPLFFFAVSLITGLLLRHKINDYAAQGARAGNEKTGLLVETLEGAETIKAGMGGWKFLSRWININAEAINYDVKIRSLSEMGNFLTAMFQQLSYAGIVAIGAWQVLDGHMTMGALIACSILSGRALAPVGMIPGLLVQYAHAKAALDGLERVYALESDNSGVERPLLPSQIKGHFRFESVRYSYRSESGSQVAINIPALEIRPGDKIGVLGAVGSGKSTLLRLLSGLYQPREGRILLDNLELSHISRQRLSEQIGYLQQDHRLFHGSLRENLLIGMADPGDDAVYAACQQTGLLALIADHPKGLELAISEGGKGLSGGQKQLVALTRLVLTQPSVWLLDEPTASMDDETERRCLQLLKDTMKPEHTAIMVTHKPSILPLVNRLIVVAQHRIVMDGPRDEVLAKLRAAQAAPAAAAPNVATPKAAQAPAAARATGVQL